jgi:hypothetical protein
MTAEQYDRHKSVGNCLSDRLSSDRRLDSEDCDQTLLL